MPDLQTARLGYAELLESLEERIRRRQVRAVLAVRREVAFLCWSILSDMVARRNLTSMPGGFFGG